MRYKIEIRKDWKSTPARAVSVNLSDACLAALLKINSMEIIDNKLIGELLVKAVASARLRQNLDLRTSGADGSQRMLNALLPGTRFRFIGIRRVRRMCCCYRGNWPRFFMRRSGLEMGLSGEWMLRMC